MKMAPFSHLPGASGTRLTGATAVFKYRGHLPRMAHKHLTITASGRFLQAQTILVVSLKKLIPWDAFVMCLLRLHSTNAALLESMLAL